MLVYILKFSACLAIFMVFYKLVLEKENMHTFKRFYLLAAIGLAIGIPLVTFIEYIEPLNTLGTFQTPFIDDVFFAETKQEITINYIPNILWSIYGLGVLFFGIKFTLNLNRIHHKIKHNPKHKTQSFTNVLLKDLIPPHTFFNYIFLNKSKFESNEIPEEVFIHEQAHATQKHSIDVLIIELLQVIFWFNPLLYLVKKDIKLNHEFLADKAVLNNGVSTSTYQEILLAFSGSSKNPELANAINYSSIKKRFTVMKTQTSKTTMWLRSLVLLPLLALLIYSFSSTKKVEKGNFSETSATNHTARSISIKVFNNGTYEVDDIKATKKTFVSVINQLHQDITPEIRNKIINIHVSSETDISDKEVWFIYNSVIDYGFHRIVTNNQEIIREKGNKPFAITNADYQQKATPKQIAEYNRLAKHINSQPKDQLIIKLKDLERLKYLYSIMSDTQKKNAEPFPNIPPPPPPPTKAPQYKKGKKLTLNEIIKKTPKNAESGYEMLENGESHYFTVYKSEKIYYNKDGYITNSKGKVLPPPPPPPIKGDVNNSQIEAFNNWVKNLNTSKRQIKKEDYEYFISIYNHMTDEQKKKTAGLPPPPPPPMSIEKLAEEGAVFYLDDKRISHSEAIKLANKTGYLSFKIAEYPSDQPIVKISSKDLKFKKALHKSVNKVTKLLTENKIILINGKTPINKEISLTKEEVINLKLTLKNEKILSFKFKVPGEPTAYASSNSLNEKGKLTANKILKGDSVQIFNIKTSDGKKHPPILIIIKD